MLNLKNRLKNISSISKLRIGTVISLLIKTIIFMALVDSSNAISLKFSNFDFTFSIVHLGFILLPFSFGYLFSRKGQEIFYLILNVLYSSLLIFDIWYFRLNYDFYGLKNILFPDTFNPMGESIINPSLIDIVFVIDIILIILLIAFRKIKATENRSIKKFGISLASSLIILIVSYILIDVVGLPSWEKRMFSVGWTPRMSIKVPGPIGFHSYEIFRTINKETASSNENELAEVNEWLKNNNENLPDNEFKGIYEGKNVIFIQIESFENFLINAKAGGQEITPFLNKLASEGLYFDNIYQQNNGGNSIDADLLVNTSFLTLGNKITALHHGDFVYENSLQRILKDNGYKTISAHAEVPSEFNWTEIHKNSLGADKLLDLNQFNYDEVVGYGLSDKSYLTQLASKVDNVKEPFYLFTPTMSCHGPFNIGEEYRELNLPKEIDESYLGGYFQSARYTDNQIKLFFDLLEEKGILDNSVIVLYGDHAGVHKYYNDDIKDLSYDGDWWKPYDEQIPLIIYSKDSINKTISSSGGHIDIMPTVLYLLGIDNSYYQEKVMGRVLVNTNRDSTILKNNIIKGNPKDKSEEDHWLKAFDIAEKYIRNKK
ncbi:MAG: LTA synthase family protein [Clostridium sp.]